MKNMFCLELYSHQVYPLGLQVWHRIILSVLEKLCRVQENDKLVSS